MARAYVGLGGLVIAVHAEAFSPPGGGGGGGGCASMPVPSGLPPESGPPLLFLYGLAAVAIAHVGIRLPRRRRLPALVAIGTGGAFLVVFLVPLGIAPARAQGSGGVTYYHQDHLGSTVIVTGGPSAMRVVYAPFGQVVAETAGGPTLAPDVGFTGQRFEAAVGLYDYGARWYHPETGHFLTPDALVPDAYDSQLLNRYAYVRNNPINKIDPTGNTPIGFDSIWGDYASGDSWGITFDAFGGTDPFQAYANLGFVMAPPPPPPPPPDPWEKAFLEPYLDLGMSSFSGLPGPSEGELRLPSYPAPALIERVQAYSADHGLGRAAVLAWQDYQGQVAAYEAEFGPRYVGGVVNVPIGARGVNSYGQLAKALRGSRMQAHHLLEKRFAALLGESPRQMLSIAVTRSEHQALTNAWRAAISYGQGTANATVHQVHNTARQLYSQYPRILRALGLQ